MVVVHCSPALDDHAEAGVGRKVDAKTEAQVKGESVVDSKIGNEVETKLRGRGEKENRIHCEIQHVLAKEGKMEEIDSNVIKEDEESVIGVEIGQKIDQEKISWTDKTSCNGSEVERDMSNQETAELENKANVKLNEEQDETEVKDDTNSGEEGMLSSSTVNVSNESGNIMTKESAEDNECSGGLSIFSVSTDQNGVDRGRLGQKKSCAKVKIDACDPSSVCNTISEEVVKKKLMRESVELNRRIHSTTKNNVQFRKELNHLHVSHSHRKSGRVDYSCDPLQVVNEILEKDDDCINHAEATATSEIKSFYLDRFSLESVIEQVWLPIIIVVIIIVIIFQHGASLFY